MISSEKFDAIVVGGGVAGLFYSRLVAEKGFSVALVEMKPLKKIGEKVCGDAISREYFKKLGLKEPSGDEVEGVVKGIRVIAPDEKHSLLVKGEGFELNRKAFGQRLLHEALSRGVLLYDNSYAKRPIIGNGKVEGVLIHDRRTGVNRVLEGKIIVDASGIAGVLRNKLPSNWWVSEKLDYKDVSVAYREIRVLSTKIEEPEYLRIYLSPLIAPGGYWWFFPKGKSKVNVGLGIQGGMGYPNPVEQFGKYILTRDIFKNSKLIHAGGGIVPTRRPLKSLVYSNFIAIGDAAFTANPLHGGGIGSSLISAWAAAKASIDALSEGVISTKTLWKTNKMYIMNYGAKQASLDLLRMFLQKLSEEELTLIIKKKIVSEDELLEISSTGDLRATIMNKIISAIKFLSKPSLLLKLKTLASLMDKVKKHYYSYPEDPKDLAKWELRLKEIYDEFKIKFGYC